MSLAPIQLRVPATSANVGPGFDTLALALSLFLEIDAVADDRFSIEATGRDAAICGTMPQNLMLDVYRSTIERFGARVKPPLRLSVKNQIPLGMGCGSSAAARVAGIALASHFGGLGWDRRRILDEAARREGHPDNAAACVLGGFTVTGNRGGRVNAASFPVPKEWCALLAIPDQPLATSVSRNALPDTYSRQDVVENLQSVALLTAGFAHANEELVRAGMQDRVHQPYRSEICELLPKLMPLAQNASVLGVALSGAGPSVLVLTWRDAIGRVRHEAEELLRGKVAELIEAPLNSAGLEARSGGLPLW